MRLTNLQEYLPWKTWLVIAFLILPAIPLGIAHSQLQQLTVATDKPNYAAGDTVTIFGTVKQNQESSPVVVQVFDPENTSVETKIPVPNSEGEYSIELGTDDWEISGTYLVRATHADDDQQATFEFVGLDRQPPREDLLVTFSDGTSRSVDAKVTNGVVTGITALEESSALILSLTTGSEDGELTIVLPRDLIDSKYEPDESGLQEDNNFMVLVDADYADYSETTNSPAERTLKIPIPAGSRDILIQGTSIMPEFPQIAVLTGAIATILIIILIGSKTYWIPTKLA